MGAACDHAASLRLDKLLVYLRFARTRSQARSMIDDRHLRRNRKLVQRASVNVSVGDVLTLIVGGEVRIIEITNLPKRRVSAPLAATFYSEYDRGRD